MLLYILSTIFSLKPSIPIKSSFDIDIISNSFIKDLSQGEKKKIGLLLAVMNNPKILILDEPFSNLDPTIIDVIWKVLTKNNRTKSSQKNTDPCSYIGIFIYFNCRPIDFVIFIYY